MLIKHQQLDHLSNAELNNILSNYWPSLRKLNGEEFMAATMFNHRQLLSMWLKEELSIDIIYDPEFAESNTDFQNYVKSLKSKGKGCVNHYPVISKSEENFHWQKPKVNAQ